MNKLDINCLKRFVKKSKKVSFTLGLMVAFLITGQVGYGINSINDLGYNYNQTDPQDPMISTGNTKDTINNFYFTIEDEKTGIEIGTDARARGKGSIATGNNSIAIGKNAVATGNNETKETIAQKLQENKDKIAEIANKKEEVKRYSNELQQLELKEKDVIAAGIRVEEVRKAKENAKVEYENLNSKYLKDVEDSKSFLAEQQAKINDLNSRLDAMSQIKGYNLNSEDGLEGAAKELKSKVENGTSLNLSLDFYKEYAQNYYKAIGDLRQNEILYDKISPDSFYDSHQPDAKGKYFLGEFNDYKISMKDDRGFLYFYSSTWENKSMVRPDSFDSAITDGLILDNKPTNILYLYDVNKDVINKEIYESFKKEKIKYIDSFNKFVDFTNDKFLTQEARNQLKKQFELKMDIWEKHAEIVYYQNNYEKDKNTAWLDKKKNSMQELENMEKTWSTFRPISEYKREEKEKFKQENITNVIEKNKYTVDTLTSELEKEMNINKNAVLEKERQLANSKEQVEQAKKNWETINPTERDLLLSKEYEKVKKELDNKKKTLLNAQERLAYLEKNLTLNDLNVGKNAIAIGTDTISSGVGAIAIGANSIATQEKTIAIGTENLVVGKNSAALGANNNIFATDSTTIGNGNSIGTKDTDSFEYTNNNFILGNLSHIGYKSENTFLIGNGTSANNSTNSIILGNNINVDGLNNAIILGSNSQGINNALSIGANNNLRKIVYVDKGEISEKSTDAINGSQLYGIIKATDDNIDVSAWKEKLGVGDVDLSNLNIGKGTIDGNDTNKYTVTGETVKNYVDSKNFTTNNYITDNYYNKETVDTKLNNKADKSELNNYAKVDASNISKDKWTAKLKGNIATATTDDDGFATAKNVQDYVSSQNFITETNKHDLKVDSSLIMSGNGTGAILGTENIEIGIKDGGITLSKLDSNVQGKLAKTDNIGSGTIDNSSTNKYTVTGETVKNYVDSKNFTTNNYITDNYYNKETVDTKLNNKADKSELNNYAKVDASNISKDKWTAKLKGNIATATTDDDGFATAKNVQDYVNSQNFITETNKHDLKVDNSLVMSGNGAGAILGTEDITIGIKDGGISFNKLDTNIQNKLNKTDNIGNVTLNESDQYKLKLFLDKISFNPTFNSYENNRGIEGIWRFDFSGLKETKFYDGSIALGSYYDTSNDSIYPSEYDGRNEIAIGGANINGDSNIGIGRVFIGGYDDKARGNIAIGTSSKSGVTSSVSGYSNILIGENSSIKGDSSSPMENTIAMNKSFVKYAISPFHTASLANVDKLYDNTNKFNLAIGDSIIYSYNNDRIKYATAITGSTAIGTFTTAIGGSVVDGDYGIAIGRLAAAKNGGIAIGKDSYADGDDIVSFGSKSSDPKVFNVEDRYKRAGTKIDDENARDTVKTRKLINVSDGEIATNSHEVVTGGQLYKLAKATDDNIDVSAWKQKLGVKDVDLSSLHIGEGTIDGNDTNKYTVTGKTVQDYVNSQNFITETNKHDLKVDNSLVMSGNGAGAILGTEDITIGIKDGGIALSKLDSNVQGKLAKTDNIGSGTIDDSSTNKYTVTGETVKNYVDSKNFTTNNYITDNYYNKATVDSKLNSKADKSELNNYAKVDASNISKDKWTAKLKGNIATATTDDDGFATAKNVQDYVSSQNFISAANKHDLKVDNSLVMSGNGAGAILGTEDITIGIKDGGIALSKLDSNVQGKLAKTDNIGSGTIDNSSTNKYTVTGETVKNYVDNKTDNLKTDLNKKVNLDGTNIDKSSQNKLSEKLSAGTNIDRGDTTLTSGKQVKEYVSKEVEKVNMKAANIDGEVVEGDNRGVSGDKVAKVVAKTNKTMDAVVNHVITNSHNIDYVYRQTQQNKQDIKNLNAKIDRLDSKIEKVSALSQATANLDFGNVRVGNIAVGAGVSTYMGNQAVAVGVAYRPNEDWFMSAKWSGVAGDPHYNSIGGSVSYQFNME